MKYGVNSSDQDLSFAERPMMAFGLQPYSGGKGDSSSLCCTLDGKTEGCYDAHGKSVFFKPAF
jgi:hypothetical protein